MTQFFTELDPLLNGVDVVLTIRKSGEQVTVSVLAKGDVKDKAAQNIPPFIISGTASEIDAAFFQTIKQPLQKTAGILTNMSEYEKSQEKADSESAAKKEEKAKAEKEKKQRKEKHDKLVKKSAELEKDSKYREAIGALNEAKKLSDKPETHDKKIKALVEKMNAGGLFSGTAVEAAEDIKTNYSEDIVFDENNSSDDDDKDNDNEGGE